MVSNSELKAVWTKLSGSDHGMDCLSQTNASTSTVESGTPAGIREVHGWPLSLILHVLGKPHGYPHQQDVTRLQYEQCTFSSKITSLIESLGHRIEISTHVQAALRVLEALISID